MVLWSRLARPFVCGWCTVVARCLRPSSTHTVANKAPKTCVPLPIRRYISMLYGMSQWSLKFLRCARPSLPMLTLFVLVCRISLS